MLLTLGSIMPGAALHPKAVQLRTVVARLAVEPSISWIDCQSRKDVMNFWDFDPVAGIGVAVGAARCNPLVWKLRFREMLSPEFYKRLRLNFFRMHYQFIMANDRRAALRLFHADVRPPSGRDLGEELRRRHGGVRRGCQPGGRSRGGARVKSQLCDSRAMTSSGTGALFIVPRVGSPRTHTRVSKPSTASLPSLRRRWRTSKLERRNAVDRRLDRHVVAEPGRNQKAGIAC